MITYVAGATGLIGGFLLEELASRSDVDQVLALVRRHPDSLEKQSASAAKKVLFHVMDFEDTSTYPDFKGPVYCCLGTTMKKAGSKEAFEKVDYQYPMALARICARNSVDFHVVTALGSDSSSMIYYNRIKGSLEKDLKALGLPSLYIYQPSLLLGPRQEHRAGERLGAVAAAVLNPFLLGPVRKYRAIQASDVARGMAQPKESGVHTYLSDEIAEMARA
ncbi:MAG: hypothetical protein CMN76_18075 [Spirochaetaceae bacterium]|nr:hypothetical protein [Spirochaetaceae bacterium]|tara:strand:- start:185140 stop:185799 length:660 start_codon:yes stop_codon:yes gene_type:complete